MRIVELIIITFAIVFEASSMTSGNNHKFEAIIRPLPAIVRVVLGFMSVAYMIMAVAWCFNPDGVIQMAGAVLVTLSVIGYIFLVLKKTKSKMIIQIDACISLVCMVLVGYYRVIL